MSKLALLGGPAAADLRARAGRWPWLDDEGEARTAILQVLDSSH